MEEEATSAAADLIAGFASGTISTLAVHPIDTVLTRFQARGGGWATSPPKTNPNLNPTPKSILMSHSGAVMESQMLSRSFGFTSLWRGAPALIGAVPFQNALLMAGYGVGKRWSSRGQDEQLQDTVAVEGDLQRRKLRTLVDVFMGGVVGGILQCFVASPAELYKVQRQVCDMIATKNNSRQGGSRPKITAGLGATMLRDGLPHGVWFASYEWCKTTMEERALTNEASTATKNSSYTKTTVPLVSGAFAAFTAWLVGYPFDLIKTRIQAGKAEGVLAATRDILHMQQHGSGGVVGMTKTLYRGFGLKLARAIPASAIGFVVYENTLSCIEL